MRKSSAAAYMLLIYLAQQQQLEFLVFFNFWQPRLTNSLPCKNELLSHVPGRREREKNWTFYILLEGTKQKGYLYYSHTSPCVLQSLEL